ncbi:MAG: ABC transporter ATP-binding protein [candidate division Zixibacteria bacterium]|nr:ABC transporter ATP-binding protein [candidate division Zixibacteria bacterium]
MMSGLRLEGVCKKFGNISVLNGISLTLEKGELLVVLGPSGCGKSTLLRLIAGLESLDSGSIYFGSKRIDNLQPKDRGIAMVFQNYSLYPHMTVEKNLAFPLKISGKKRGEIDLRVKEVASLLGLSEKLGVRPAELSGGQRQRVALGRAIIRKPELFLLDEPLSNLDADLRSRMRKEIVRIQRNLDITTIHVTHDQAEALTMADRIAVLNDGVLLQVGNPGDLYTKPANLFVAGFLGFPRINIMRAIIDNNSLSPFGIEMSKLPVSLAREEVLVGIRPEHIRLDREAENPATVVESEYLGDQHIVTLRFKDELLMVSKVEEDFQKGAKVKFTFNPKDLLFFDTENGKRITSH